MSGRDSGPASAAAGVRREFLRQAAILGGIVALLWLLEAVDLLIFRGRLNALGIRPRTLSGLRGIALAPFLHVGFAHLAANTIPFIVLGWLVMLRSTSDFFVVAAVSAVVSGLGVWLFGGPHTVHVGLSGVIFGFLGYLLARGIYERRFGAIVLALLALLLYGGALWGVLPLTAGVSWQGHLFGFLGGWLVAYLATRRGRNASIRGRL
jgi:membrane associated rhomboid family serine protease